ncbi:hypothetical protein CFP56_036244 [Quercus suber]|uniref:Uncharacterized protein n=1 Tax=Quercus suber TaxID=58331 RepID=A0AAW0J7C2_QUESU
MKRLRCTVLRTLHFFAFAETLRNDRLQRYYCLACSPEDEFGSDYDSSISTSDCVSSSESCATGPKRVEFEDRSEDEKKKVVKRSISSSVTEISGGGDDSVFSGENFCEENPFLFVSGELTSSCFLLFIKIYTLFGFQES